ncbi:MAG: M23 family metallopeptidase [Candidatus Aminicenantes bacterium]|nr:M23 family metallopeptidase [Candidatus Aminicenantes bacterium]
MTRRAKRARELHFKRTSRRRRLPLLARRLIVLLGGLTLVVLLGWGLNRLIFSRDKVESQSASSLARFLKLPPQLKEQKIPITLGQNLAGILAECGFSPVEVDRLRSDVRPVYNLDSVRAGRALRLYRDEDGRLIFLEYDIDDKNFLRIRCDGQNYKSEILAYPVETRVMRIQGVVENILISAFNAAGESDLLALEFAEIFAWDVDFYIDLRKGDRFNLVYEKVFRGGAPWGYGRILAAEFWNQGRKLQAFRFTYPDTGRADYFDAEGNSLRKEFMKSPLKYGRITSRFSSSRLHPIRKIYRSHYGVDYAAPVGTPVRATADGRVISAGWSGAAGRMVKIRHRQGYQTRYLHLSRFAEGIKAGAAVASGQVIGYVGNTGESTGPHLDYRITQHGKPINPLGARFEPAEPLRPEFREAFDAQCQALLRRLSPPPQAELLWPFSFLEKAFFEARTASTRAWPAAPQSGDRPSGGANGSPF